MDLDEKADALLARIRSLRDDLDAGRLSREQVGLYRNLGRRVGEITRRMDAAPDAERAKALWMEGADLIQTFLDEHFPPPTRH